MAAFYGHAEMVVEMTNTEHFGLPPDMGSRVSAVRDDDDDDYDHDDDDDDDCNSCLVWVDSSDGSSMGRETRDCKASSKGLPVQCEHQRYSKS